MIALILVAFSVVVPNTNGDIAIQKNANNFGPYTVVWNTFDLCKGPKAKNLSQVDVNVVKEGEDYVGYMNFTFIAASRIDELLVDRLVKLFCHSKLRDMKFLSHIGGDLIKIVVSTLKDNIKSVLWAYNLKDPCQHFVFADVIQKSLKARNCAVEKGTYENIVNFSELTTSFLGKSFFYGDFNLKANVISKKGNILCVNTNIAVGKKEKAKSKETA